MKVQAFLQVKVFTLCMLLTYRTHVPLPNYSRSCRSNMNNFLPSSLVYAQRLWQFLLAYAKRKYRISYPLMKKTDTYISVTTPTYRSSTCDWTHSFLRLQTNKIAKVFQMKKNEIPNSRSGQISQGVERRCWLVCPHLRTSSSARTQLKYCIESSFCLIYCRVPAPFVVYLSSGTVPRDKTRQYRSARANAAQPTWAC